MGTINVSQVVGMVDKVTAWYVTVRGSATSGEGMGTAGSSYGGNDKATELEALGIATADYDIISILGPSFRGLRDNSDIDALAAAYLSSCLSAMNVACAAAGTANSWTGVSDLDTFAGYHNLTTATKWQCLFPPDFYGAYSAAVGRAPTNYNVYYEVLQSGGGNGLGKLIIGTGFSSPGSIDNTLYAGGFGQVTATGVTGSDTVTVAGTWRKTDGSTATGNGTAAVSSSTTVVLTPPFTAALLLAVTNITAGAGLTAGTFYAEAKRPSARDNPPL